MRTLAVALLLATLFGVSELGQNTTFAQVYGYSTPTVYRSYYAPTYVYSVPVVAAGRRIVYSPVITSPMVVPQVVMPAPVVVATPTVVASPVVIGPTGKVYIPGRPVRNTVRAVVP